MKQAIREMGRVKDPRYKAMFWLSAIFATAWRSSYKELTTWLRVQ